MYQILFAASLDRVGCVAMARNVLIVGTGSIGERHARCFGQLSDVAVERATGLHRKRNETTHAGTDLLE